jgi:hypothetical protein
VKRQGYSGMIGHIYLLNMTVSSVFIAYNAIKIIALIVISVIQAANSTKSAA